MKISPVILGSGAAGLAIAKSLAILNVLEPAWEIAAPRWVNRGEPLGPLAESAENPILVIANPHALHAPSLVAGDAAGFRALVCEKPSSVSLEQCALLRAIKTPTAVLHVYRQMWGAQTIQEMCRGGELGELIAIEGKYWQSSVAETALRGSTKDPAKNWKIRPELSGPYDAYLDIGSHWVDLANFFAGELPGKMTGWRTNLLGEAPHRDTHLQLSLDYSGYRGLASVSKIAHGAANQFEIQVIGSKKSVAWNFMSPDELVIGEGRNRTVLPRSSTDLGSRQWPFHGMGWVEGYIEILRQLFLEVFGGEGKRFGYPSLAENVRLLESMLQIEWIENSDRRRPT